MAGCGCAVFLLGLVTTGRWARATAARTAALLGEPEHDSGLSAAA